MLTNIRNFAITLLVSLIIFGTAAYFISGMVVDSFEKDENIEENTGDDIPVYIDPDNDDILQSASDQYTVLMIGTDYSEKFNDYDLTGANKNNEGFYYKERPVCADSIVLININKSKKEVLITPIPGDMYVTLNGAEIMLNKAFDYVDIGYFCSIVSSLTSLQIDNYFSVSLDAFPEIIDTIGGINFDVPCSMQYNDDSQNLHINLKSGEQTLDGSKALDMLRYVSYSEGNSSRMKVAINFLKSVLNQAITKSNYSKAPKIFSVIKNNVETDFSIIDLAENLDLFFMYPNFTITDYTYPLISTYNEEKQINDYFPNTTKAYEFFKNYKTNKE